MNRAEYRRKQRQTEKAEARYWVTQRELRQMAKQQAFEMFKQGMLEFRDNEKQLLIDDLHKMLDLYKAIWFDVLGDMGLVTRDNKAEIIEKTTELWAELDGIIMNNNQYELRNWVSKLGADPDTFGILERPNTPEEIAEIYLEVEE